MLFHARVLSVVCCFCHLSQYEMLLEQYNAEQEAFAKEDSLIMEKGNVKLKAQQAANAASADLHQSHLQMRGEAAQKRRVAAAALPPAAPVGSKKYKHTALFLASQSQGDD